jgi:hypothetical protein
VLIHFEPCIVVLEDAKVSRNYLAGSVWVRGTNINQNIIELIMNLQATMFHAGLPSRMLVWQKT